MITKKDQSSQKHDLYLFEGKLVRINECIDGQIIAKGKLREQAVMKLRCSPVYTEPL